MKMPILCDGLRTTVQPQKRPFWAIAFFRNSGTMALTVRATPE